MNGTPCRSFDEGVGRIVFDLTRRKNNGKIVGGHEWKESPTKPLILPNVKKTWHNALEGFLLDV